MTTRPSTEGRKFVSNSHYDPKLPYFRLWGANNWAFRVIRLALQHKIGQMLPAIKAQVGRQHLHIIDQTPALRQCLKPAILIMKPIP
jgi:hypothetical protein